MQLRSVVWCLKCSFLNVCLRGVLQAFGSVSPAEWCLADSVSEVEIRGEGFTDNAVMEDATCTFQTSNGNNHGEHNEKTSTSS